MTADRSLFKFPDNFAWEQPETWPEDFRSLFEYAAQLAYLGLADSGKRMLDVRITGTTEPVTMLFAVGERADELRQAWRSVYAIHNKGVPELDIAEAKGDA